MNYNNLLQNKEETYVPTLSLVVGGIAIALIVNTSDITNMEDTRATNDSNVEISKDIAMATNSAFSIIDDNTNNKLKEDWIVSLINESLENDEPEQLPLYFDNILELLSKKNFDIYDNILFNIDIKNTNETILVSLLRLSFMDRHNLTMWEVFHQNTSHELYQRGHNINEFLHGLS
ncbi:MAG: hypothetical protein U9R16_03180 [Campylobacterota bacterium]|nr:hypothetical protein [Campylobacterota bacterium]